MKNETKSKNIVIDLVDEKEEESMKKKRKIEIHLVEDDFEQIEKKDVCLFINQIKIKNYGYLFS